MSPTGGANGPASQVALGMRFEFSGDDGEIFAAIVREDIKAAGIPRAGERLGAGSFGETVHGLVGDNPTVDDLHHFLRVPHSREWAPLTMMISQVAGIRPEQLRQEEETLIVDGWTVLWTA